MSITEKTLEHFEATVGEEEDVEALREVVFELIERMREREGDIVALSVDPKRNKRLAEAVYSFAEWHTSGYGVTHDNDTRQEVSRTLWSEVSENVRAITGRTPESAGFDAAQLDFSSVRGRSPDA